MIAVGHLIGYGAGTVDLVKFLGPMLGDSQFKQLTSIAALALIIAVGITSYAVEERILISSRHATSARSETEDRTNSINRNADVKSGAFKMIGTILKTTMHLPAAIQAICWVQFWAWIGIEQYA